MEGKKKLGGRAERQDRRPKKAQVSRRTQKRQMVKNKAGNQK